MPAGAEQGDCRFIQARDRMRTAGHGEPDGVEVDDGIERLFVRGPFDRADILQVDVATLQVNVCGVELGHGAGLLPLLSGCRAAG
jgi:hypothetical protein